jgi:Family of unknown function (DUF5999)
MCPHTPPCPAPSAPDREAAHTIVSHPEQGWSLLCNGVVIFEDTGELLPGGAFIAPHRPTDLAAFDRPAGVAPGHGGQAPAALSVVGDISRSHPRCSSDDSSLNSFSRPSLAPGHRPQAQTKVTYGGQPVSPSGGDSRVDPSACGSFPVLAATAQESARVQCQPDPIAASARAAVTPAARAGSPLANRRECRGRERGGCPCYRAPPCGSRTRAREGNHHDRRRHAHNDTGPFSSSMAQRPPHR